MYFVCLCPFICLFVLWGILVLLCAYLLYFFLGGPFLFFMCFLMSFRSLRLVRKRRDGIWYNDISCFKKHSIALK